MRQLCIGIGVLFCFSCGTETSEIGVSFFREGTLDISYIDTVSVKLSTVRFEKLTTSNVDRILVGSNDDSRLGRISAAAFVQLGATGDDLEEVDATFDYLALTLHYNDYFYYDTTAQFALRVHRVTSTIEGDEAGSLYNTSNFPFQFDPVGSLTFKPRPTRDDTLEVRLSDALGREFFEKAKNGDEDLTSSDFLKYFKGLVIVPDTTASSCILGFTSSPELRLYYWDKSVVPAAHKFISFNATTHFTKISTARINPRLAALVDARERISSNDTNDESYIQSGAGLALRVDISHLRDLKQLENFFVTQAQLDIYVTKKSFDNTRPLEASLIVYPIDKNNAITSETSAPALLVEDTELGRYTHYTLDVTSFVKTQMERQEFNDDGLMFSVTGLSSTVNRICFASPGYEYKTRLRIYYATVNTN
jgi:hypothetical protein